MAEHPVKAWDSSGRLLTREESWGGCAEASKHAMRKDGSVNWRAAFFADPGLKKCPACERYLWNEGPRMECPCGKIIGEVSDG